MTIDARGTLNSSRTVRTFDGATTANIGRYDFFDDPFTIYFRITPDLASIPTQGIVFGTDAVNAFRCGINGAGVPLFYTNGTQYSFANNPAFTQNTTGFLAFVYDGTAMSAYFGGSFDATTHTVAVTNPTVDYYLGGYDAAATEAYAGVFGGLNIAQSALSAAALNNIDIQTSPAATVQDNMNVLENQYRITGRLVWDT